MFDWLLLFVLGALIGGVVVHDEMERKLNLPLPPPPVPSQMSEAEYLRQVWQDIERGRWQSRTYRAGYRFGSLLLLGIGAFFGGLIVYAEMGRGRD
jgi:hypothetical protein